MVVMVTVAAWRHGVVPLRCLPPRPSSKVDDGLEAALRQVFAMVEMEGSLRRSWSCGGFLVDRLQRWFVPRSSPPYIGGLILIQGL